MVFAIYKGISHSAERTYFEVPKGIIMKNKQKLMDYCNCRLQSNDGNRSKAIQGLLNDNPVKVLNKKGLKRVLWMVECLCNLEY